MKKKESLGPVLNFIVEAGLLKRLRRSGWDVASVPNPESVADHSFRCALIAYFLGRAEGADPYKAVVMALFNDIAEARITDLHKIAQRYIEGEKAEDEAFSEQVEKLPDFCKKELIAIHGEYRAQKSRESKIARDADILECLIQAKEYCESGNTLTKKFMLKAPDYLVTESGRKLWEKAKAANLNDWWQSLGRFKR